MPPPPPPKTAGAPTLPLLAAIAVSIVLVALADAATPLGYVEWMLYTGPVALAAAGRRPWIPPLTAAVAVALIAVGFFWSDATVMSREVVLVNRTIGAAIDGVLGAVGAAFVRGRVRVAGEVWLRDGENRLQALLEGNPSVAEVGARTLGFLRDRLSAEVGAFHVSTDGATLRRVARLAGSDADDAPEAVPWGATLVGECAASNTLRRVVHVPPGYLTVRSGLGAAPPRELVLIPLGTTRAANGVAELGFFRTPDELDLELLDRLRVRLGVAIRSADDRERADRLLEETQRQAEELQSQQEELRATNEELEAQAEALRDSQRRLELQHRELERTNAELEEQAAQLEERQQELLRARAELERANAHKSQFLANMSHELRTPLNSTLILSKLLAENATGTLNAEQVKFAETIYAAGNDLLALVSDILDLSKIEAGRFELAAEPVPTEALVSQVERLCRPLAASRGLSFAVRIDPAAAAEITTDRQRVQQILRNLLSNALKFTERGGVEVEVAPHPRGIAFHVHDTGVGIAQEHHAVVFEAFRQLDTGAGHAHGGTGLGLSISRELARVLGGDLTLASEPGRGSTFTLILPLAAPPSPGVRPAAAPTPVAPRPTPPPRPPLVDDDRERIEPGDACLLVVEDDPKFASVVVALARDAGLPCLVAADAADGISLARRYRPTGIVLDVRLPDDSGLTVLERLKRDPATRHIPIHVVSVADHTEAAFHLGAVGYAVKPLDRDQLVDGIRRLQRRAAGPRSVLVVEDDAVQRDSICALITTEGVTTEAVGTVQGALERLAAQTYDCLILDLELADGSGFDLLDRLAAGDRYAFPPVIVYTGRALEPEAEQRLRAYSSSVIVKGARSPERLVDEVALFLHQVERTLPDGHQRMLRAARTRDAALEDRRILVVEDDVRNVFALTSLLEPRGAVVEIARNGQEALDRLDRPPPIDLVLMDVMMPVMDGLEAMRRIRQRPELQKLPIIALTAKAMADDRDRCLAAGADDYAAKPLDVDRLLSLIRVWMPRGPRPGAAPREGR